MDLFNHNFQIQTTTLTSDIFRICVKWCHIMVPCQIQMDNVSNISCVCYSHCADIVKGYFFSELVIWQNGCIIPLWQLVSVVNSNMTSFKRFESKPVVKIILIYDRLNLWRHRQFITIFYQFLHIRIEIIHGSHMYILFLPQVGLYVSFLPLAYARGKPSWHKGIPVVKAIYTYGFQELFLKYIQHIFAFCANNSDRMCKWIFKVVVFICWIIQVERSLQLFHP